jgi:TatD DNase family protein
MIDTHTHLDFENFGSDREAVLERFWAAGGQAIINIGVDQERIEKTLEICQLDDRIGAAIGFHPEEVRKTNPKEVVKFLQNILQNHSQKNCVKAIGEIGLDYFHDPDSRKEQLRLLAEQLKLAKQLKLPAVLHCREAYEDLQQILNWPEFRELPMVLHCYMGNQPQTEAFLRFPNLKFSFTGNITFNSWEKFQAGALKSEKAEIFRVLEMIPLERIMVETDCPFLAPQSHRGERNEPAFVQEVLEQIARVKGLSYQEAEALTDRTAEEFFGLGGASKFFTPSGDYP